MAWVKNFRKCYLNHLETFLMPARTTFGGEKITLKELLEGHKNPSRKKNIAIDPDTTTAFLFAGQGSQHVGMVDHLLKYPNVPAMFNKASEILNFDLLGLCQRGPQSELDRTVNCQPALLVTSLAAVEYLQESDPAVLENCVACAGYSVGEYAALVFSGALSFEDAISLVKIRAQAMQDACDSVSSSMVTAIGHASTKFKTACLAAREHVHEKCMIENPVCGVSAYLCPNTVTIAGHTEAIQFLQKHQKQFEIRKIVPIPVSGAFHTDLMQPAKNKLLLAVKKVHFEKPTIQVYSNCTGKQYATAGEIKHQLPLQVVRPVLWEQSMHKMLTRSPKENMPHIYDAGPGHQLGNLLKRCNGKAYLNYMPVNNQRK